MRGIRVFAILCIFILYTLFLVFEKSCSYHGGITAKETAVGIDEFKFICDDTESDVINDIKNILAKRCPGVRNDLLFTGFTRYTVQIFKDQQSYDNSLADRSVSGSPACSGAGKIWLVSPRYPLRLHGITYDQRLTMAVHEYTHLLVNDINAEAPIWLAEGIACYEGAGGRYIEKGSKVAASLKAISLSSLENSYYDTPGADVYSFLAVHFIINTCGYDALNRLLRNPDDFEHILNLSKTDFDSRWSEYICAYGKG